MTPEQESQLQELIEWKRDRENEQIIAPLDEPSKNVIYRDVPLMLREYSNSPSADGYITVEINGRQYNLLRGQ